MASRVLSAPSTSWLGAAFVCLAIGSYCGHSTRSFVAKAERAEGTVIYSGSGEDDTLLVRLAEDPGRASLTVPVRIAWWTPPWSYLDGDSVAVLYDPTRNYDVPSPVVSNRIAAPAQLWSATFMWLGGGALLLIGWLLARVLGAETRADFRLRTDD